MPKKEKLNGNTPATQNDLMTFAGEVMVRLDPIEQNRPTKDGISRLETRIDGLDSRMLDGFETQIDGLDSRMNGLERAVHHVWSIGLNSNPSLVVGHGILQGNSWASEWCSPNV